MPATAIKGLLGADTLHARIDELKRAKGTPPWAEKIVVNDQIVGTLICQPAGHQTDTHYHLLDEWWFIVEGEIDWEIEGQPVIHAPAPATSSTPRPCTITTSSRRAAGRRSAWPSRLPASSTATTGRPDRART